MCVCAQHHSSPPHAPLLSSPPLTLLTPLLETLLAPWMAWMTVDDQRVARAVKRSFVNELHPDVLEPLVLVDARRPDLDERANSRLVRFHPRNCLNLQQGLGQTTHELGTSATGTTNSTYGYSRS